MRQKKKRAKLLPKDLTKDLAKNLTKAIRYLEIDLTVTRVTKTTIKFVQTEFSI